MENSDKLKVTKRMITIMLCILIGAYAAFLFAPELFKVTIPEQLIDIDIFITNHKLMMWAISCCTMYVHLLLFYLSIFQKWKFDKWWEWIGLALLVLIMTTVTVFVDFPEQAWKIYSLLKSLITLIIIPIIIGKHLYKESYEKMLAYTIVGLLLYFGYQEISFLIKDVQQITMFKSVVTGIILLLDVYIVQFIIYTYLNYIKKRSEQK